MEVRHDFSDSHNGFKIDPDHVSVQPEETDLSFGKLQTVKTEYGTLDTYHFESQSTEQFENIGHIKQEFIECDDLKTEQLADLPVKIEDTRDVKGTDLLVDINALKQKVSEQVQFKIESEFLTSYCDLPTFKDESAVYPDDFEQPCSSKQAERTSKSLKSTAKYVPNKKKRRHPCPVCLKRFPCSKSRLNHFVRHFGKRAANHLSSWKGKHSNGSFGKYHQDCFYCGRFFLNGSQFLDHFIFYHYVKKLRIKSLLKCKYCLHVFVKQSVLDEHLTIHTVEKLFKCEICFKKFDHKSNLTHHLITHTDSKPIGYEIYSKQFRDTGKLKIHIGDKPFKCEICSRQFRRNSDLKKHSKVHTGDKPFKCEICSKQFSRRYKLTTHLTLHSGERPLKCEICSRPFSYNSDLKKHMKIHTGEKPFKCEICLKQCRQKSDLNRHLKIHTGEKPFKCEVCSKYFNDKTHLNRHLTIHTDEKPFKCETCSRCFRYKNALNYHLMTHTGEKPFKCEICSRPFREKSALKGHLKIHYRKSDQVLNLFDTRYP